jgi:hypothetical protein
MGARGGQLSFCVGQPFIPGEQLAAAPRLPQLDRVWARLSARCCMPRNGGLCRGVTPGRIVPYYLVGIGVAKFTRRG